VHQVGNYYIGTFSCIYLFHVSTYFERHSAHHHQEIELY